MKNNDNTTVTLLAGGALLWWWLNKKKTAAAAPVTATSIAPVNTSSSLKQSPGIAPGPVVKQLPPVPKPTVSKPVVLPVKKPLPAPVMVAKPVITTVTNSQPIAAKVARFTGGGSCALAGIGCLQSITDYAAISY